jgi:hypothetical protein
MTLTKLAPKYPDDQKIICRGSATKFKRMWIKQVSSHARQASLPTVAGVPTGFQYAIAF